uniref:Uncharacterized protein n=1 Tax=Acrobeloides nanus TaxID=290746 RepID=A0A914EHG0_9BILA
MPVTMLALTEDIQLLLVIRPMNVHVHAIFVLQFHVLNLAGLIMVFGGLVAVASGAHLGIVLKESLFVLDVQQRIQLPRVGPRNISYENMHSPACNSYFQQRGCSSGGCDLYYSGVADNLCACDTCLSPSQYCTQAACNAKCTAAGFGCHLGNCDQGICNCFICPNNFNTG